MKTLGNKISDLRKNRGMTQEDLANTLNVSSQAVSKWENDLSIPDLPILIQMSDLFNISLDELLKQKENLATPVLVEESMRKPIEQMLFRVIVDSADGDRVRVNLPMSLVKMGLAMGIEMPQVNGQEALKGVDLKMLLEMVEKGLVGKLVEVDTADGDHVEVVVE